MKITLICLAALLLLPAPANAATIPDSGMVRLLVDLDGVAVSLDGEVITSDSCGQQLEKDVWFLLRVTTGLHALTLVRDGYDRMDKSVVVRRDEVTTLEISFLKTAGETSPESAEPDSTAGGPATLLVRSEPDRARVFLADREDYQTTPVEMALRAGDYNLEVLAEGFEPLTHTMDLEVDDRISLNFLLKEQQPRPMSAEELGLNRMIVAPLKSEEEAGRLRRKFTDLAETFAIVPLGQGVLARLVMGEDTEREANVLIIAGAGLTVGSYLLGKVLSAKKLADILARNKTITEDNKNAKEHNKTVDRTVKENNAEALDAWREENKDRGRVEVQEE